MIKNVLTSLLLFAICQLNAQVTFSPAIRAGLNMATLTEMESSYKNGFYVGFAGGIDITKIYTLQPEITYSQQGTSDAEVSYYNLDTGEQIFTRADLELNYLSLAIMNRFNIADGFNVAVGPTLDFLISDNMISRDSAADIGIMAGLGYKSASGFAVEARVKKGLVDTVNNEYYTGGDGFFFGNYNTNLVFQVGAAYYFDLSKKQPDVD